MGFRETIHDACAILTEGSVIERLRREHLSGVDPLIGNAGYLYDPLKKAVLRSLYREYIDIAWAFPLPMLLLTPTWRANPDRLQRAGLAGTDVNGDGVRFLNSLRLERPEHASRIFIGGLLGPKGDAYNPDEALKAHEAFTFHQWQADALARAGADFLIASTLPAFSEALGIANAMGGTGLPTILSFILRPEGTLLDGTPLHEAVDIIDSSASPRPFCYVVNCVHPTVFQAAFLRESAASDLVKTRVIGLQANTSSRSPEELEGRADLDTEDPEIFASLMSFLAKDIGIKILGGCCGTDGRHIAAIARKLLPGVHAAHPGRP